MTFKKGKPFTFLVDTSAVAGGKASCTNPVTIPDVNLKAAVREALGKSSGDITCADMVSLTKLDAVGSSGSQIANLEGLQFAPNLTSLDLTGNNISDLTPIQGLIKLTRLHLGGNNISNLKPLQDLTKLTDLELNYNNISDLSPLQPLTKLTELDLSNNNISSISALVKNSGLDSGDYLDLATNPLSPQALNDIKSLTARGVDVDF